MSLTPPRRGKNSADKASAAKTGKENTRSRERVLSGAPTGRLFTYEKLSKSKNRPKIDHSVPDQSTKTIWLICFGNWLSKVLDATPTGNRTAKRFRLHPREIRHNFRSSLSAGLSLKMRQRRRQVRASFS